MTWKCYLRVMTTDTTKPYEVWTTLVVDRPELRGPTYAPVRPGHRQGMVQRFATQAAALRYRDAVLRGEDDYASEYIAAVTVVQARRNSSPRIVRRRVEWTRQESTKDWRRNMLAVGAARRGNVLAFYADYYCEAMARKTGTIADDYDSWTDAASIAA